MECNVKNRDPLKKAVCIKSTSLPVDCLLDIHSKTNANKRATDLLPALARFFINCFCACDDDEVRHDKNDDGEEDYYDRRFYT